MQAEFTTTLIVKDWCVCCQHERTHELKLDHFLKRGETLLAVYRGRCFWCGDWLEREVVQEAASAENSPG